MIFSFANYNPIVKLSLAVVILLAGFVIAILFSKLIYRLVHELEINRIIREQAGINIPVEQFLSSTVRYIIYFIAVIMSLSQLGLTTTVLYIILIIILIILVSFIVLAFKDFIPNLVAGFLIFQKNKIKIGDNIKMANIEGKVVNLSILETQVKTRKGDIVFIPNSLISKNQVVKKK